MREYDPVATQTTYEEQAEEHNGFSFRDTRLYQAFTAFALTAGLAGAVAPAAAAAPNRPLRPTQAMRELAYDYIPSVYNGFDMTFDLSSIYAKGRVATVNGTCGPGLPNTKSFHDVPSSVSFTNCQKQGGKYPTLKVPRDQVTSITPNVTYVPYIEKVGNQAAGKRPHGNAFEVRATRTELDVYYTKPIAAGKSLKKIKITDIRNHFKVTPSWY